MSTYTYISDSTFTGRVFTEDHWACLCDIQGLASGSVRLISSNEDHFPEELFVVMQKVALFWESKEIKNYFVYKNSQEQGWEMVPYEGTQTSSWDMMQSVARQFEIFFRVVWGRSERSKEEQNSCCVAYHEMAQIQLKEHINEEGDVGTDVFCNPTIINRQQIGEKQSIRILHDYAPLGEDRLHFLLVPKAHKERLTDLSLDEFCEMQQMAQKIISLYPDHICYQYHKTGKLAGQTVNHFHHHLVFVKSHNEWQGQLGAFFRMIIPSTPLSSEELQERIEAVRTQLRL